MELFSPKLIAHETRISDARWDSVGASIVWLENRPDRGTLAFRTPSLKGRRDLSRSLNVRARVGYGGGDFSVASGRAFFISENGLYLQALESPHATCLFQGRRGLASPEPSPDLRWVLLIGSTPQKDSLCLVPNQEGESDLFTLHDGCDFYMQPVWHRSGLKIAWVSWNSPYMPWDQSEIWIADLDLAGSRPTLIHPRRLPGSEQPAYFFQPEFSPCGNYLAYISDTDGWSNLSIVDLSDFSLSSRLEERWEHAPPAWVQGMRSFCWSPDARAIYFIRSQQGFSRIGRFDLASQHVTELGGELSEYTALRQLSICRENSHLSAIASASGIPERLIEIEPDGVVSIIKKSSPETFDTTRLASPEAVHWSDGDSEAHGIYYAPSASRIESTTPPPAVIRIHGGPTSQYLAEWEPETHFFTSRGYAVLGLNYRGSFGYGRAFRDALRGQWGSFDVEDTRSAHRFLVDTGRAHPDRVLLSGGSAGGFTLLLCLCRFPSLFQGAICRFGVSDLFALEKETHKFEAHYLDFLIGPLPDAAALYQERSPVNHVGKIRDPIAIFQGSADVVVPQSQSDAIARSLRERDVFHFYRVYEGEGHGFRRTETIEDYYKTIEQFLDQLRVRISEP